MNDQTADLIRTLEPWFQPYVVYFVLAARRARVPLTLISGRRSDARNAEVGGAAFSLHVKGEAFDVSIVGYNREQLPAWFWNSLGAYWKNMGGRWGGDFSIPDVNHFDTGRVPDVLT